ncbi:MAG: hypothetical protein AB1765_05335 [Candidatus Hydrogenedentota bacterium]
MTKRLFFSVGDFSSDLHTSEIITELFKIDKDLKIFAVGGDKMKESGAEILEYTVGHATVGFIEAFFNLPYFYYLDKMVKRFIFKNKPALVVLVDNPGFNLRLAEYCYELNIPVIYFIPPQVWAWYYKRIKTIKRCVKKVLFIFPFEEKLYKDEKIEAKYVGNPLFMKIKKFLQKKQEIENSKEKNDIAILPGSRLSEWLYHIPIIKNFIRNRKDKNFVISIAETLKDIHKVIKDIEELKKIENLIVSYDNVYNLISNSEKVLCSSGTVSLESALLEKPGLSFYKTSLLNYYLAKKIAKLPYISLPNLILYFANEKDIIYKELIQQNFNIEELNKNLDNIICNKEIFKRLKELIRELPTSKIVANEIYGLLG